MQTCNTHGSSHRFLLPMHWRRFPEASLGTKRAYSSLPGGEPKVAWKPMSQKGTHPPDAASDICGHPLGGGLNQATRVASRDNEPSLPSHTPYIAVVETKNSGAGEISPRASRPRSTRAPSA